MRTRHIAFSDPNTGELLNVDYSDSTPDVTYTYNRLGQQATVADAVGTRTFSYNDKLQLDTETIPSDLGNRELTRKYQGSDTGEVPGRAAGFLLLGMGNSYMNQDVTYGYDTLGRLETVNNGARTFTYTRETDSDLLGGYSSGSFSVDYDYEPNRNVRTKVQSSYGSTPATIAQFDYVTDSVGRRQTREQSGSMFTAASYNDFDYNDRGEVTQSKRFAGTVASPGAENTAQDFDYTYDPIGNRRTSDVGNSGTPRVYTANDLNQITAITQPAESPQYDYDGNETSDGTWTREWDGENRLVKCEKSNKKLEFVYDYMGRRVRKLVYSGSTGNWTLTSDARFIYDGWNLIASLALVGGDSWLYMPFTWGLDLSGSLQGAGGVGGLLALDRNLAYCYDGNGNVVALINAGNGTLAAQYEYGPFGESLVASGYRASDNPFQFSTKFRDSETGNYYYGYRSYNPIRGSWLSRDPILERGGMNLYAFVRNHPISSFDSFGLSANSLCADGICFPGTGDPAYHWPKPIIPTTPLKPIDPAIPIDQYNCGGCAFRTYQLMSRSQVEDRLKNSCSEANKDTLCASGKSKCKYYAISGWKAYDENGKYMQDAPARDGGDFHIVCGDELGNGACSKNGFGPVSSPQTIEDGSVSPSSVTGLPEGWTLKPVYTTKYYCCNRG